MRKYSDYEIEKALEEITIIADTREQDTEDFRRRFKAVGLPIIRRKLDFGDYSAIVNINGEEFSLENQVVIERKMSVDELCMCFGKERQRFQREFQRAKEAGARIYLVIENGTWENMFTGRYRSRLSVEALTASLAAWSARYNLIPLFCKPETSGRLIALLLKYELRERLGVIEC
jgi:ERCC4-type nuclease